ncbi:hypothetical protein N7493_011607 [Penicillium malachiteum]|uniref:Uncharacterized protein n=1 Tax=Penicillium malachiteum TaxID=1324776 RepID=A0AAD6HAY7_9EURO|nr:hypothetical protein N7493_011607 [Penicillium malachiteum]
MAVCALTAGRLYDALLVPTGVSLLGPEAINLSSQCYTAAVKAMPADITTISDYCQAMKASALLTSVCLQNGNLKRLVAHLSDYIRRSYGVEY